VFIVAEKAVLSGIKAVEYTLHPTFPNPVRQGRGPDFAITANGWGEFNSKVKITFKDKKKPEKVMNYWLKLFTKSKSSNSETETPTKTKQQLWNVSGERSGGVPVVPKPSNRVACHAFRGVMSGVALGDGEHLLTLRREAVFR
jgi:transcription initiation factor IIF auxiliary subunit